MTNLNRVTRSFKVIVCGELVTGTACPEWPSWELREREAYLDDLFGKKQWKWA